MEKDFDTTPAEGGDTLTDFESIKEKAPLKYAHKMRFLLNWTKVSPTEIFPKRPNPK